MFESIERFAAGEESEVDLEVNRRILSMHTHAHIQKLKLIFTHTCTHKKNLS